jgi:hypothetical protein
MPLLPQGTNITSRVSFNSGYINFGNSQIVQVENVGISLEWTTLPLMVLNSIKAQDLVRHTQKVSMTGKIISYPAELDMIVAGSSTIGGVTNQANTLDGQPTMQNPTVTMFDRNGKEFQYQFINAIFKSNKLTAKMEDYTTWDFELDAIDILEIYTV